jgi:hypothetical protein
MHLEQLLDSPELVSWMIFSTSARAVDITASASELVKLARGTGYTTGSVSRVGMVVGSVKLSGNVMFNTGS